MKIVLTGFMTAGKTTAAKKLALQKKLKFYDSDILISEKEKMSIEDIFANKGEKYFRKIEEKIINGLLDSKEDFVLAVGGGAVVNDKIREKILSEAESFCLDISPDEVLKRNTECEVSRPLLEVDKPLAKIENLLKRRKKFYQEIPVHINSEKYSPAEIVEIILKKLPAEEIKIKIKNKDSSYSVIIDKDYKKKSFNRIIEKVKNRKLLLLVDEIVLAEHAEFLSSELKNKTELIILPLKGGEKIKSLSVLEKIYDILFKNNFSRSDYLIAFGGGTIGDLGALAASTYLRGIKLIQMPTTLISQLDSSVGGKTAVNFKNTKNLIGSFYQAEIVYYQLQWLETLPIAEIKSGLGEVIKYAVLGGNPLFDFLKNNKNEILNLNKDLLLTISKLSLKMKDYYVTNDVKDTSMRKKLNLGHSFGHAVEAAEQFKYKHGEAVVMGIAFTAFLSNKIGSLNDKNFKKIIDLIKSYDYKLFPAENIKAEKLASFIAHDKKISDNKMWWVLINDIGDCYLSDQFNHENIGEYMEEYLCKKWL